MSVFQIDRRSIANFDFWLVLLVLGLNAIGILNLTSAAVGTSLWKTQLYWVLLSLGVMTVVLLIDYQQYLKAAPFIYIITLLLVIGVHFFGHKVGGAQSWYRLGFANFQPSEMMKIAIILMLARYYHRDTRDQPWGVRDLLWPAFIIGLPLLSILKEPDMGTALTIVFFSGTMLLFAGIQRRLLIAVAVGVILSAYPVWHWGLRPHQKDRIRVFLNPHHGWKDEGYQSFQCKIAVGSGGLLGKGYKRGKIHMLRFLPAQQTDFVFGVWAEEWGFVWVAAVIGLYATLIFRGLRIGQEAKDRFGLMVAVGVTALLFWHIFINIAMIVGVFPIIGVPLPFMSYGGSNLLTFMTALGLLLNVRMRKYLF